MALSNRLQVTAQRLLAEYGNIITLRKKITGNKVYDPVIDEYVGTDESIEVVTSCTYPKDMTGEVTVENSNMLLRVVLIPYSEEYKDLDTTWTLNGNKIYRVESTEIQDAKIAFKAYIG